ncbi:putative nucleotidyltransferase substrate binding domain-containing protein [Pseudomaricurvus alcaniphilus]|uniref:putative nucleotidyltransferase substrate binding domain-containing protein n=1 Tax=Pseudomaricurvus alcaniphilus TaxID=1166482 RepID=UPI001FB6DC32|nr:putative nucleotidyltransferase substrate binding domain-containing protein [Pseudomaricurvus alcaniphilus]
MSPELQGIRDFLVQCVPFDQLSEAQLEQLVGAIVISYHRRGHVFHAAGDEGGLRILRSGAAELRSQDDSLLDRFGERVGFDLKGLELEQSGVRATLIEDSLIYRLPEESYRALRKKDRDFDRFFHSQRSRRMRRAGMYESGSEEMMQQVGDLMTRNLLVVAPTTSIQQTALLMSQRRVSSVLIQADSSLLGIVTDRDLRSRAVAKGLGGAQPIAEIMTANPQTISADSTVFDATLLMTRNGIHHVPVLEQQALAGIITASDLLLARRDDPVYLVQHIGRQDTVAGIREHVKLLPDLMVQWVNAGVNAARVSRVLTAVSDAVTERLIELYVEASGPPPTGFCWLGFGSQGRAEQLLGSDQDNALLIAEPVEGEAAEWFTGLATWVCDGLNECGYVYCPGKVMATTDEWRQPLAGWRDTVDRWTRSPTSDAVMRVSIFFDLRCIYGDQALCEQLQQHMLAKAGSNTIFLAALAENALANTPPLGIFRQFVVERNGEHEHQLNLKKRGVLPIIDLVRVHALAHGVSAVNTIERLQALADAKVMSIEDSRNLQDALRLIMQTRIQGQVRQLTAGVPADNYIDPAELSRQVRGLLRDSFSLVADAQQSIKLNYRAGL